MQNNVKLKMSDLLNAIESTSMEVNAFLNTKTGDICVIDDESISIIEENKSYPKWMEDGIQLTKKYLENPDDYMELPSLYDFNERRIMEKFSNTLKDENHREKLQRCLHGKGMFRRFKDTLYSLGVGDNWYQFREEMLKEYILDWCEVKELEIII